jgi:hypothetical protein
VFAKEPGGKAPGPHAVLGYLRRLLNRAGLDKKVTPAYATRVPESGAFRSWISRLLVVVLSYMTERLFCLYINGFHRFLPLAPPQRFLMVPLL